MTDMIEIVSGSRNSPSVQYVTVSQPTTVSLHPRPRAQTHQDKPPRPRTAPNQESLKNRPSILRSIAKPEDKTQMEGDAKLELPDHPSYVMLDVSDLHCAPQYSDTRILCSDGEVFAHSLVLCSMSPFLKRLLKEAWSEGGAASDWVRDEYPVISLPEVKVEEITLLLALLYTGSVNLYKSELSKLVALTHQLKLVSIPVAVVEEAWDTRFTPCSAPEIQARASISFIPPPTSRRGRPSKPSSSQVLASSSQILASSNQVLSSSSQSLPSSNQSLPSSNHSLPSSSHSLPSSTHLLSSSSHSLPSSSHLLSSSSQSLPSSSHLLSSSSQSLPSSSHLITSSSHSFPLTSQILSSSSHLLNSTSSHMLSSTGQLLSSSPLKSPSNPVELQQDLLQPLPLSLHVPQTLSIEPVDSYKNIVVSNAVDNFKSISVSNAVDNFKSISVSNAVDSFKSISVSNAVDSFKGISVSNAVDSYKNISVSSATLLDRREMDMAKARQAATTRVNRNVVGKHFGESSQHGSVQITLKETEDIDEKSNAVTDNVVFKHSEVHIEELKVDESDKHDLEVEEFEMFVNEGEDVEGQGTTLIEISEEGHVERMEVVKGDVDDVEGAQQIEMIQDEQDVMVEVDEGKVEYLERTSGGKRGRPRQISGGKKKIKSDSEDAEAEAKDFENEGKQLANVSLVQTDDGEGEMAVVQTEDADGLDSLISVAEAFERSQQPDFNDIASPIVDGTDTEKQLVRNCLLCNKSMLGRNALGRHMKNVHPKVFGPYRCPVPECPKLLDSGAKLMTHMYSHTGGRAKAMANDCPRYQCSQCDVIYTTTSRLNEHLRKKHNITEGYQEQKFACNAGDSDCQLMFPTARKFIQHMKSNHKLKPWLCDHCNKRFMERQNYQYHLMSHEGRKNFACDICNKSFANPRQLYCHRALHLGKRFLCQDCGFRARSSANLRGHIKAKHEGKQYNCGICTKKFSSANNLKNHVRIHTGETPYECELCGVKFKRMHHLHSHIESKIHIDIMEKCRRKGYSIPERLDPLRRARGRPIVEDGPVTLVAADEFETHITEIDGDDIDALHGDIIQVEGEEPWKTYSMATDGAGQDDQMGQVVVVEEQALQGDLEAYVIPVSGGTVEIVQAGAMAEDGTVTLQLPGGGEEAVTLTEQEAIAFTSGGQIFVTEGGMEGMDVEGATSFVTAEHHAENETELSC